MGVPLRSAVTGPGWSSVWRQTSVSSLGGWGECAWSGRAGRDGWLRVFPDGCADVTWDGDQLLLHPARSMVWWARLRPGRPADGVRLRPGAAAALFGPAALAASVLELRGAPGARSVRALESDLRAAVGPGRRRALLSAWVADQPGVARRPPLDDSLIDQLAAGGPLPEVAAAHGLCERTLRRHVLAATGMAPRPFGRLIRFHRFVVRLPRLVSGAETLAAAAVALGYADQSHLGRECRSIAATTPAALVGSWRRSGGE